MSLASVAEDKVLIMKVLLSPVVCAPVRSTEGVWES